MTQRLLLLYRLYLMTCHSKMSIKEYSAELRALFMGILDVETGDGACALSLLDALEESFLEEENERPQLTTSEAKREESSQEIVEVEVTDLANHVADMNDMMLEMILELNKRIKVLESK